MSVHKQGTKVKKDPASQKAHLRYLREGLNSEQVAERRAHGAYNAKQESLTRSVREIITGHLFSLFNFLNFGLGAIVLFASFIKPSHLKNLTFLGVVFANLFTGIMQELKAKETVDSLSILVQPHCHVLRNGHVERISVHDIVLDDILLAQSGEQLTVDGAFLDGEGFEVDESQLTGEAESQIKKAGDPVFSGSFVVAGRGRVRVTAVGSRTYAQQLIKEAKRVKEERSQLRLALQLIIRMISVIILPIGVALALSKVQQTSLPIDEVLVSTVAALIGMIPEGLMLLTEMAFANGTIKLAREKLLVQTSSAIEMLARIDVLCLDKTGTITTGKLEVADFQPVQKRVSREEIYTLLSSYVQSMGGSGGTQEALEAYFTSPQALSIARKVEFSSARKWSALEFGGHIRRSNDAASWNLFQAPVKQTGAKISPALAHGSYYLGAAEFLLPEERLARFQPYLQRHSAKGQRILLFAHSSLPLARDASGHPLCPKNLKPLAFVLLNDEIRQDAPSTFHYFREQGVDLKIISGDNPETVTAIARRAGFGKDIRWIDMSKVPASKDLRTIAEHYQVFGRVNPYQKRELLKALQSNGHCVGMTGDGVNDVPALREADCSIAMVSGMDAARRTADIVLLEDNMSSLIQGVYEGRRIINNLERVATLFLVKTVYSTILSFLYIFLPSPYPIFPIQMTLISSTTIGIPAFFLALKPNRQRVEGNFIDKVFSRALPAGLAAVFMVVSLDFIAGLIQLPYHDLSTVATMSLGLIGFIVLTRVSSPLTWPRFLLILSLSMGFLCALVYFPYIFNVEPIFGRVSLIVFPSLILTALVTRCFMRMSKHLEQSELPDF